MAAGVYTDTQATRGATAYETNCSGCHNPDLAGGSAPALKEARFARDFAGKDLTALYSKILKTMPRNDPGVSMKTTRSIWWRIFSRRMVSRPARQS